MELRLNIGYKELLELVKQLSPRELLQLKELITETLDQEAQRSNSSEFGAFLLNGPVMKEEKYQEFLESRKLFDQWRKN